MDGSARISIVWGDGEQTFRLALGQLRELQDKAGCGPQALYERLCNGQWRVDDMRETLRLGLIGGGMAPPQAAMLVQRYCDERPLGESLIPAIAVLAAAIVGVKDDPIPKASSGKGRAAKGKRATGSPSPRSMEPAAP